MSTLPHPHSSTSENIGVRCSNQLRGKGENDKMGSSRGCSVLTTVRGGVERLGQGFTDDTVR